MNLKKGLPEYQKLELSESINISIGFMMWIILIMILIINNGIDTVIKIWNKETIEIDILVQWRNVTIKALQE